MLNLAAALDAPVASSAATLSFGGAAGDFSLSRTLTLTNISGAADAFTLSMTPVSGSLIPNLSTNSFTLGVGQSLDVGITWSGTAQNNAYFGHFSF